MDIREFLEKVDPDIIVFLLATLVAFISWLIKGLIEKPLTESKQTFQTYFDRRIEILTEIKTRLTLISYFPAGEENIKFKQQLQEIFLKDGKTGYLSKEIYHDVLKISIDASTNETILLNTIGKIESELALIISKIQEEISFYRRFSNYAPFKRFIGLTLISIQYIMSLALVISFLILSIYIILKGIWYVKLLLIPSEIFLLYKINRWLHRKTEDFPSIHKKVNTKKFFNDIKLIKKETEPPKDLSTKSDG